MGVYNATIITAAGQNLIADAIAGGEAVTFSSLKTSTHVYPAGTSLQNLTALDDVKQSVSPTSVEVYNNNVVQISARVPNTGIATAYLINTIGLFGQVSGGTETLIAVLTASTPDEVPVFDPESPAAFIFNVQMTIQNADTVTFEVNDSGTATVADLNRVAQPFSGATASAAGTVGRVPAPAAGADGKFLRGDATWAAPADMVENFASSDVADGSATTWTSVSKLDSGENNSSIFAKVSQMFKNVRYLYKMLGTTDISAIGNGTITNALSVLNAKTGNLTQAYTNTDGSRIAIVPDPRKWGGIQVGEANSLDYGLFQLCEDGRASIAVADDDQVTYGNEIAAGYAPVIVRAFSIGYTANKDTAATLTLQFTPPERYTPVGVVGYNCGSNRMNLYTCYLASPNRVAVQLHNFAAVTITSTFTAYILFRYDGNSVYSVS